MHFHKYDSVNFPNIVYNVAHHISIMESKFRVKYKVQLYLKEKKTR